MEYWSLEDPSMLEIWHGTCMIIVLCFTLPFVSYLFVWLELYLSKSHPAVICPAEDVIFTAYISEL